MLFGMALLACAPARAEQKFKTSEIVGPGSELFVCDLDGDGLKDLVLLDDLSLSVFFQDRAQGFTQAPQQIHRLEHRPCVVWAAKLGKPAESLLVMTSDGVTELVFTNRAGPPEARQIIRQPTIVPPASEDTNVLRLTLSVEAGRDWPLLLVPAADGLQVWQHRDEWVLAQTISHAIEARLAPSVANPGYNTLFDLDLSVGDVNGDGRDDLMVRRRQAGRVNTYTLYLQQTNGLFASEPALTHVDNVDPHAWLCWADLNHDGKVDLIKSVWLNEPSFIPGAPSGKVLVSIYQADAQGRIPAEPQQVYRKNDWLAPLPVVDVDGDGFQDLVLGYSHLDSRDSLSKEITTKTLDYTLRFFFYRPGGGFPKEADCQHDVAVHLDEVDLLRNWGWQDFGRFVSLGGDFNGDGKTDLLVRDHADAISVYFFVSREKGFGLKPDLRFSCPEEIGEWRCEDLNHDGVSDLIVKLAKRDAYRVFISQK